MSEKLTDFDRLTIGDTVIQTVGYDKYVKPVEKVTALHIIVDGCKYRKRCGQLVNRETWKINHIEPATPEMVKKVDEDNLKAHLICAIERHVDILSNATLTEVTEIYEKLCAIHNRLKDGK